MLEVAVTIPGVTSRVVGITFPVYTTITVRDVKAMIQGRVGIRIDQQRLIYGGLDMEDGRTLGDYNLQNSNDPTVRMAIRGLGGAKRGRASFEVEVADDEEVDFSKRNDDDDLVKAVLD
eukprot:3606358-Heterocapsa_arctica.AAC.1